MKHEGKGNEKLTGELMKIIIDLTAGCKKQEGLGSFR